ncbi:myosin heavy chain, clone 203-like [Haliotis rufescens]|uniref:myosin heavy chain, clone 203-like n=1 Tax=Haliotis rufescens TaxID=6454 RepID=UPI001EAFF677|nr:myosin heavy chain, clone 203-like [Haliotis rufescens]
MQKSVSPERVPREALHEQHERLTTKHIQTLSFLQDIVNENKQLKARVEQLERIQKEYESLEEMEDDHQDRIKQIQEQYMNRADEINAMLAEKHKTEILQLVDEKVEIEKNAYQEITKLKADIEVLQQTNRELLGQLGPLTDLEEENKSLKQDLENAKKENENLKSEYTKLEEASASKVDVHHLQGLKAQNEALQQHVKELEQKKHEMEHRISRLEAEVVEKSQDADKVKLIDNLRLKLEKLHKEKADHLTRITVNEAEIQDLTRENEQLKGSLIQLEKEKEKLASEFRNVLYELQTLRKQLSHDNEKKTFRDYVMVKREVNVLREENAVLRQRNKLTVEKLPVLKPDRPQSGIKGAESRDTNKRRQLALPSSGHA